MSFIDNLKKAFKTKISSKSDINNNSAKLRKPTPEVNDNDDVVTSQTAEADVAVSEKLITDEKVITNNRKNLEHDYPSDPNETDQVSSVNLTAECSIDHFTVSTYFPNSLTVFNVVINPHISLSIK